MIRVMLVDNQREVRDGLTLMMSKFANLDEIERRKNERQRWTQKQAQEEIMLTESHAIISLVAWHFRIWKFSILPREE